MTQQDIDSLLIRPSKDEVIAHLERELAEARKLNEEHLKEIRDAQIEDQAATIANLRAQLEASKRGQTRQMMAEMKRQNAVRVPLIVASAAGDAAWAALVAAGDAAAWDAAWAALVAAGDAERARQEDLPGMPQTW